MTDITEIKYLGGSKRFVNNREYELGFINYQWTIKEIKDHLKGENKSCGNIIKRKYLPDGKLNSETDANGKVTAYTSYDTWGRPREITEAQRTKYQRYSIIKYHPIFNKPARIIKNSQNGQLTTEFQYDDHANVINTYMSGLRPDGRPISKRIQMLYDDLGRLVMIDGAQPGEQDRILYYYHPNDPNLGNNRGRLHKIVDTQGTTEILNYNGYGNIISKKNKSGLLENKQYNDRQQVIETTLSSQQTNRKWTYDYYPTGLLKQDSNPEGQTTHYQYNSAKKLKSIQDDQGTISTFQYDEHGNIITTTIKDKAGKLLSESQQNYDELNRLKSENNALKESTHYHYKKTGEIETITDALSRNTGMKYDILGRVENITDPLKGITYFTYDERDNIISITDPIKVKTQYSHDDFGNPFTEQSADRGVTQYLYDPADQLVVKKNEIGHVTQYAYNPSGQIEKITYGGKLRNKTTKEYFIMAGKAPLSDLRQQNIKSGRDVVRYEYGKKNGNLGKLTKIEEDNNTLEYQYNDFGELKQFKTKLKSGEYLQTFQYHQNGQLKSLTLPSGKTIRYQYDNNNITNISLNNQPILKNITYTGLGEIKTAIWGNGLNYSAEFDEASRLKIQSRGNKIISYGYDPVGNIKQQGEESYQYDDLDRLKQAVIQSAETIDYQYDANGNRLVKSNGETINYKIKPKTNQLKSVNDMNYQYNAIGNRTEDDQFLYYYNVRNRLEKIKNKSTGEKTFYGYNSLGLRVFKKYRAEIIEYVYNVNGLLIAEINNKQIRKEYIWFGNIPIAVIENNQFYYIHTDHLGTPRIVTGQKQQVVWEWKSSPFGIGKPVENGLMLNFRFPGQYYDEESGLYYNWNRYYDAEIGRYITADPIGLDGNNNIYLYVYNSPIQNLDKYGLWASQKGFLVHQRAIRKVINSSARNRNQRRNITKIINILIKSTEFADSAQFQNSKYSFRHAMRNGKETKSGYQTIEEARALANNFIKEQFNKAIELKNCGKEDEALFEFGLALHTLQDYTSPAHHGFQEWTGEETSGQIANHVKQEMLYPGNNTNLYRITEDAYSWYKSGILPNGDVFIGYSHD